LDWKYCSNGCGKGAHRICVATPPEKSRREEDNINTDLTEIISRYLIIYYYKDDHVHYRKFRFSFSNAQLWVN
jgi:hypothetical protein